MAEHMIETRILLRYDTLSNWLNSTVILKPGEAAIAAATNNNTIGSSNDQPANTPPAVGIKIGDGFHYFYELPWVQGVAGDVYSWAKQQNKPVYNASEIQGLTTLIEQYVGGGGGGSGTVEARAYRLVQIDNKYYLQSKGAGDSNWVTDTLTYIDLTQLATIVEWLGTATDDYWNIGGFIIDKVLERLATLNFTDNEDLSQVVTAVDQVNGLINVTRRPLSAANISGTLSVENGGTGKSSLDYDSVLVGNGIDPVILKPIESVLVDNNNFATNHAIISYINNATAGITSAMHFRGEATVEIHNGSVVNPRIPGYNFFMAEPGDVILFGAQEYVWNGQWILLGDEGSYAVKGSIVNSDIASDAEIGQSKIANLVEDLYSKVDKVDGKQLSTNDYTTLEKNKLSLIEDGAQVNAIEHIFVNDIERPIVTINGQDKSIALSIDVFDEEHATKLDGIETGAQVNVIEHIFVNGEERPITTINNLSKSVNIIFNPFTDADRLKLDNIEAGAQVNTVEKININGTDYYPGQNKDISITLDSAALNLTAIEGARVPSGSTYEDVEVDSTTKKLELARIAKSGNVTDLLQTSDTYVTLYCGTSTDVI